MASAGPVSKHRLHPGYSHKVMQAWNSAPAITANSLIYPLFIVDQADAKQEIGSMPGQYRWGVDRLPEVLDPAVTAGLQAVLLFGVIDDATQKDERATSADSSTSPVILAIQRIRRRYPGVLVMTDLCLCGYTSHGHCGILHPDHTIDNTASIARLAQIAVAYASAGAQVIAPSDMMDGRIGAIKSALKTAGFEGNVAVMSYAAKFASCFYGPFRDAAHSGMSFGDRSLYQLPPGSEGLAMRAVDRDLEEGADFVMVKPGMPYLDIVRATAERSPVPVAVYQVSGEWAMITHAAAAKALDFKRAVMESLAAFKRAGATVIISYFTPQVLTWLREEATAAVGVIVDSSATSTATATH